MLDKPMLNMLSSWEKRYIIIIILYHENQNVWKNKKQKERNEDGKQSNFVNMK